MMKKIVLALALIPTVSFAAVKQQPLFSDAPVLKTYTCQQYTDNEMSMGQGFLTDNPITPMEFKVDQTKFEFVVHKNGLFEEDLRMTIPEGGNISGVAGTLRDMFFRRIDGNGKPYFIVYLGNRDPRSNGQINRAVFIAGCEKVKG